MSKKLQLQIPTPCHEDWDNMSPVEKGRFCSSCQKQVVDFSRMSDREVAIFFKKPSTGSVCGRFMEDQLNRDIDIPRKRIPWVKYFFQFLLPGFLLSMKATAQQGKVRVSREDPSKVLSSPRMLGEVSFKPVKGDTLIPVPVVVTTALSIKRVPKEIGYVTTNQQKNNPVSIKGKISNGEKKLIKHKNKQQKVTAIPELNEQLINQELLNKSEVKPINNTPNLIAQQLSGRLGGVIVRVGGVTRCYIKKQSKAKQIIQRIFRDTLFNKLTAYPNPIKSNSTLHIEWNQTENGYHVLQLFNLQGQLMFTKEMFIDDEAKVLSVDLPSLTAGNYFLKMTNKKTSRSYTSKILVE
jgi:hypothetical protein